MSLSFIIVIYDVLWITLGEASIFLLSYYYIWMKKLSHEWSFVLFQVVVASGAVKHEDIVGSVKGLFTKLSSDSTTASQLVAKEPAIFTGSEVGRWLYLVPILCSYVSFIKIFLLLIFVATRLGLSMMIFLWHNLRLLSVEHLGQIQIPFPWWSCRLCWVRGIRMLVVESTWGELYFWTLNKLLFWHFFYLKNKHWLVSTIYSSELAQRVGINEIAESLMAFNTNYKDIGLFGVYAVAKVRYFYFLCLITVYYN